jgi:pyruvate dehydrogenase E2 component (dihydrolipoamide acetyltransferase)
MPHEITIPRLGWSMEEGILGVWLKSPGEMVRAGESLFSLEGEKATQEIESLDSGCLCIPPDAPRPGETVKVGQVIGFLLIGGETPPISVGRVAITVSSLPATPAEMGSSLPRAAGPAARRLARQLGIDLNSVPSPDPTGRVVCEDVQRAASVSIAAKPNSSRPIATPRARRRAKELGVDWTTLTGTGREGRIRERDLFSRLQPLNRIGSHEPVPGTPGKHTPATKRRSTIAQRMVAGVTQAAPVTLTTKVDAEPLIAFRNHLKKLAVGGQIPSYNDILIHLVATTLREYPQLNACWHREGIFAYDEIHIATAVDVELGLLAPVIRHADQLTLEQIAERTRLLIAEARSGRLGPQQLEGGTFTVTNLGMFGIDTFTPIHNLPQAGILGVGRIIEEPVIRAGQIVIGHTLSLSLTFDHRVVDGAPAARWLQALCKHVQALKPSE